MGKAIDLTGHKYHRWTVLEFSHSEKNRRMWKCRCDCGNEALVPAAFLRIGHSKSCGCWNRESAVARATTHGGTKTPLFSVWKGMLNRCRNPNTKCFKNYGARGIGVAPEWHDFAKFREDMGAEYEKGLTLERIDNDKGYEPGNCKWIPKALQSRNRRNVVWVETSQGRMTVAEAARAAGLSHFAIRNRFNRGCPPERILDPSWWRPAA